MLNLLFIAEMNEENNLLGKSLFKECNLVCGFWLGPNSFYYNSDFFSVLEGKDSEFNQQSYIINFSPTEEDFFRGMTDFIYQYGFSPDAIIIRGKTTEIWPLTVLVEKFGFNHPCYLLAERVEQPLNDFDTRILKSFRKIFLLSPQEISDFPCKNLFYKFNAGNFVLLEGIPTQGTLLTCSREQYSRILPKLNDNPGKLSIINIEDCPQDELFIYLNATRTIIEMSQNEEFRLILSKMKKYYTPIKDFDEDFFNYNKKEDKNGDLSLFEKFSSFLKKGILSELENDMEESFKIVGEDIGIEEI
jgi:hypothetical protein